MSTKRQQKTLGELQKTPLWTAIITPMEHDLSLDLESFENLLREQEKAGNGVVILGSTGEGLNLDEEEKKEIVRFTSALGLEIPVMVGIGGFHQKSTLNWLDFLEAQKGLDCYLLVTPLYAKPGYYGQYHWFETLLDQSSRPCMLYNVPGRTGIPLNMQATNDLNKHPQFWAIKEASGSVEEFKRYREAAPQQQIFSGDDALTPDFAPHGASGLVSVSANVWPAATRLFVERCLSGKLTEEDRELWVTASKSLFCASNPTPAKALLFSQGRLKSPNLKPPLDADDLKDITPCQEADKQIKMWYEKNQ